MAKSFEVITLRHSKILDGGKTVGTKDTPWKHNMCFEKTDDWL